MDLKIGDKVQMPSRPRYRHRHWWEFWRPRWIMIDEGGQMETYTVTGTYGSTASAVSPKPLSTKPAKILREPY